MNEFAPRPVPTKYKSIRRFGRAQKRSSGEEDILSGTEPATSRNTDILSGTEPATSRNTDILSGTEPATSRNTDDNCRVLRGRKRLRENKCGQENEEPGAKRRRLHDEKAKDATWSSTVNPQLQNNIDKIKLLSDVVFVYPAYRRHGVHKKMVIVVAVRHTQVKSGLKKKLEEMKTKLNIDYFVKTPDFPKYADTKEQTSIQVTDSEIKRLTTCIQKNADGLLSKHTYLSIVQGNFIKPNSIKHNNSVCYEPRLVLYVFAKGFIPIDEDPFETQYDDIKTEVREGTFQLFGNQANDIQDNVRMGCSIERETNAFRYWGTLGVFFEHQQHGLCGITCGHAILSPEEHIKFIKNETNIDNLQNKIVYQPYKPNVLGHVVQVICSEGNVFNSGNDIIVVKIDERRPVNGKLPQPKGATKELDLEYTSGRVFTSNKYQGMCCKFGRTTEYTKGAVELFVGNVTKTLKMHGAELRYSNLIVVNRLKDCEFACPGDSGAPVFVQDGDGEHVCIGLLLGGVQGCGPYYVIPIEKILNDIGITKLKSFSPSNAELKWSIEKVEQSINTKIDNLERKIIELALNRSNS